MRVVFMGTPDFALYSLEALYKSEHTVTAVVTQPDRPGNRGAVVYSPVKRFALERGIPVLQYEKIGKEGVYELRSIGADIFVTAAYGQILSRELLDIPPRGIVNVHASLLPKYRGSSPVQWALINGEKQTGITIMQTAEGLDTGDILYVKTLDIGAEDNAGTLFVKLGKLGAEAIIEYLDKAENGEKIERIKQNEAEASYFPMLKKSDGLIDWSMPANKIADKIRGVTPWPGAYTYFNGKTLKVHGAEPVTSGDIAGAPGEVLSADKRGLIIACGEGTLGLLELQPEGKKRMWAADFINGNKIARGDRVG